MIAIRRPFSRAYLANFGERVRTLRERQGVTLKQLAQVSGLSDRCRRDKSLALPFDASIREPELGKRRGDVRTKCAKAAASAQVSPTRTHRPAAGCLNCGNR